MSGTCSSGGFIERAYRLSAVDDVFQSTRTTSPVSTSNSKASSEPTMRPPSSKIVHSTASTTHFFRPKLSQKRWNKNRIDSKPSSGCFGDGGGGGDADADAEEEEEEEGGAVAAVAVNGEDEDEDDKAGDTGRASPATVRLHGGRGAATGTSGADGGIPAAAGATGVDGVPANRAAMSERNRVSANRCMEVP